MAYEFKFPFEPPWEDLVRTVKTKHATCYIFDTCCKNFTKEDKARTDANIMRIYMESERMKRLKTIKAQMDAEETEDT